MNLSSSLALALSAVVGGSVVVLTADDLHQVYVDANNMAASVQEKNDAQLLEAARLMHEMQTGRQNASVEELVAAGYLKPEFLKREKVQKQPTP